MIKQVFCIVSCVLSCDVFSQVIVSNAVNPVITSHEYKQLLDPGLFRYGNEMETVQQYFEELKVALLNSEGVKAKKKSKLSKQRNVLFYDTPGSCQLRENGYSFRERVKIDDDESSVSLKFRSTDLLIAGNEDLESSNEEAKSKFELDVGYNLSQEITSIYSVSTTYDNPSAIKTMADINNAFPAFKSQYHLDGAKVIESVSGLTIYERVYEGMKIDLGSMDANFSLTLWYLLNPTQDSKAIVAEVSFSYGDKKGLFGKKSLKRAKSIFKVMNGMQSWNGLISETKTNFIYGYVPTFCAS